MNYSKILKADMANGEGWGVSIFFSGCSIRCRRMFQSGVMESIGWKRIYIRSEAEDLERA